MTSGGRKKTRSYDFAALEHVGNDADEGGFLGASSADDDADAATTKSQTSTADATRAALVPAQDNGADTLVAPSPGALSGADVAEPDELPGAAALSTKSENDDQAQGAPAGPSLGQVLAAAPAKTRSRVNDRPPLYTTAGATPPILQEPASPKGRKKKPGTDLVLASYMAAQTGRDWENWSGRLVPQVKNRLFDRAADDCESSGRRRLAAGHYLDAALRRLPAEVEEQAQWADAFLVSSGGEHDRGVPVSASVSPEIYEYLRGLKSAMRGRRRGMIVQVVSAAVVQLLDILDAEGPMDR